MLYNKAIGATASAQKTYIEDVFSTYLYTGTSATQTITNGIDLSAKGGLLVTKSRTSVTAAFQWTSEATGLNSSLESNSTSTGVGVAAFGFNSDGYAINTTNTRWNASGSNYVSWTFRKAAKFFDVVTYTGNGTAGRSILHNLGSVPGCIIVKRTDSADYWRVYHRSKAGEYGTLNETIAFLSTNAENVFGNGATTVAPTSTQFTVASTGEVNANGGTYVAYLFAHDAGGFGDSESDSVVSCGSFTADGSGNATVTLGWEPQWVLFKRSDNSLGGSWFLVDSMRGMPVGGDARRLLAESSAAEADFGSLYPTATGFASTAGNLQASGTYIYIAIRRGPMKTPTDATKVFNATASSAAAGTTITTGFPLDSQIISLRSGTGNKGFWHDRLRGISTTTTDGGIYLTTNSIAAEASGSQTQNWSNTGFNISGAFGSASTVYWNFRRAPGFFDVVAYTGTGANRTVAHNLGVVPELIITKPRNFADGWGVYAAPLAATKRLRLDLTNAESTTSAYWNNTNPTSSVFTVGTDNATNGNTYTYIAYLFATCPGVSKVGSYTGTGTTKQIDCGFTNGARFVLIKRTDSTGDWHVWDTARGIVSGNDPYLLLNSTAAEVTNTDYIDPLSSGFEISSTAPAAINANGGTFIYLSVA